MQEKEWYYYENNRVGVMLLGVSSKVISEDLSGEEKGYQRSRDYSRSLNKTTDCLTCVAKCGLIGVLIRRRVVRLPVCIVVGKLYYPRGLESGLPLFGIRTVDSKAFW